MRISSFFLVPAIVAVTAAWAAALAATSSANDYPTSARAEYVFACMKTNGETRQTLEQCSCSIDVIASLIPYDSYVAGETVASMDQEPGQVGPPEPGTERLHGRPPQQVAEDLLLATLLADLELDLPPQGGNDR